MNCTECRFQARCATFEIRHNTAQEDRQCPLSGAEPAKEVTEGRLFVDYTTHQQLKIYAVPIVKEENKNDSNR